MVWFISCLCDSNAVCIANFTLQAKKCFNLCGIQEDFKNVYLKYLTQSLLSFTSYSSFLKLVGLNTINVVDNTWETWAEAVSSFYSISVVVLKYSIIDVECGTVSMWQRRPLSRQCSGSRPTGNTGAAIKIYFDPRCQFVQAICNVSLAQLSLATRDAYSKPIFLQTNPFNLWRSCVL